jgi:hypothetical protein
MGKAARAKAPKGLVKRDLEKPKSQSEKIEEMKRIIAVEPVSRGKRKRAMKKARVESRKEFIQAALKSKLKTASISEFGGALGDFTEMVEAINAPVEAAQDDSNAIPPKPKKAKWLSGALSKNKKAKADALDIQRFKTLMNIPDFASDPIAAMEKHLQHAKQKREEKEALLNRKTATMDQTN